TAPMPPTSRPANSKPPTTAPTKPSNTSSICLPPERLRLFDSSCPRFSGLESMKRIPRDPVRFDVFKAFAAGTPISLHDQGAVDGFKSSVAASLGKSLSNPKFLYGQHVQSMFQGVVIAL